MLKLTEKLSVLSNNNITNAPWSPHFPALRDSPVKPMQTSFSPLTGFLQPFISSVNKLHVCDKSLCIPQLCCSKRSRVLLLPWTFDGRCLFWGPRGARSTQCVLKAMQINVLWKVSERVGENAAASAVLWSVLILSALWLIEEKTRWSPACGQPPGSY